MPTEKGRRQEEKEKVQKKKKKKNIDINLHYIKAVKYLLNCQAIHDHSLIGLHKFHIFFKCIFQVKLNLVLEFFFSHDNFFFRHF